MYGATLTFQSGISVTLTHENDSNMLGSRRQHYLLRGVCASYAKGVMEKEGKQNQRKRNYHKRPEEPM